MSRKNSVIYGSPHVIARLDALASQEGKTIAELLPEMVRIYEVYRKHRDHPSWVDWVVEEMKIDETAETSEPVELIRRGSRLMVAGLRAAGKKRRGHGNVKD